MVDNLRYQDIETIALVVFTLIFVVLEKLSPKHRDLDVKSHLKMDIMAFILIIVSINISRPIATLLFETLNIKALGIIAATMTWPFIVKICIAHLLSDFCLYWLHRAMHKNETLWRTHQFHHSAEALYWLSGFRTSFTHVFLYAFPQVFVGFFLFHFTPLELGLGFSFGAVSNLFTHSNLNVPKWLPLHWLLVTPDFHHPHHSQMGTQNKNFGNVFSIWDRLFGTYVDPKKIRSDFKYGLKDRPVTKRMMFGI